MNRSAVPPPVTKVMEAAGTWLPPLMNAVEERLEQLVVGHGAALGEEGRVTLSAGGKRLRPLLVLVCAGPEAGQRARRAATAVELVHMATLVHDDVLDAAPLRRGLPTVIARSGRERATAVGDLLFSRAFAELAAPGAEPQVRLLAHATVGLALGELAQRHDAFDTSISAERYRERCELKTARLFECASVIGRAGSELDDDDAGQALATFGREIGLAFQLLDDVLDVSGPPERTGKARGTDLLDGTATLPLILACDHEPALRDVDLRSLDVAGAEEVCDRITATGALDQVRESARRHVEAAKGALDEASLTDDQRQLLGLVADGVVERYA